MAAAGLDTAAALRERQRLAAREDVEEELFVSLPTTEQPCLLLWLLGLRRSCL